MNQKNIQNKVISGIGWSSFSSIISYLLIFSRIFILVRFLSPDDFGIMALSLMLLAVMKQFSHVGLEQAVIQEENISEQTINTVWTVSIIRGVIFFALINIFTPFYANYFNESELVSILTILSFSAIFNGLKNSYISIAEKNMRFDVLFKLNVSSNLVEFITSVVLAIIYQNVIALAIGYLASSIIGMVLSFFLLKDRPSFTFNMNEFFKLFKFGKWVFGSGMLVFLILNIDTTVIGKILGVTMLGFYQIAFRLGNFAATDIVLAFSRAIYPSFSLVKQDLNILKNYFLTTILLISIITLPIMLIIGFYAESFVTYFIGNNWLEVIVPLKILVVFGIIRAIASVCGYVFWALGKPKIATNISFFQLILISIIILPFTYQYGVIGTAISVTIPLLISSFISFYYVALELKIKLKDCIEFLSSAFISIVFLVITIFIMRWQFDYIDSIFLFLVNATVVLTAYSLYLLFFDYFGRRKVINIVKEVWQLFIKRKKSIKDEL
jgi:lipopolysaccharide exporter